MSALLESLAFSFSIDGVVYTYPLQISGTVEAELACSVAASTTNQAEAFEIAHSALQAFAIVSDQNVTMYVNAASGDSPILTVDLLANEPYIWANNGYFTNPFSADLTALYFSNAGETAANIQGLGIK